MIVICITKVLVKLDRSKTTFLDEYKSQALNIHLYYEDAEDQKEEGDIKRVGVRKSSKLANGAPQLLNFLNLNFLDKGGYSIRRPISLKTKP